MNSGTGKWYDSNRGFGFTVPEDGGEDVFVHATALQNSGISELKDGKQVRFNLLQNKNGKTAAGDLALTERAASIVPRSK